MTGSYRYSPSGLRLDIFLPQVQPKTMDSLPRQSRTVVSSHRVTVTEAYQSTPPAINTAKRAPLRSASYRISISIDGIARSVLLLSTVSHEPGLYTGGRSESYGRLTPSPSFIAFLLGRLCHVDRRIL